jgi:hypothetical protein
MTSNNFHGPSIVLAKIIFPTCRYIRTGVPPARVSRPSSWRTARTCLLGSWSPIPPRAPTGPGALVCPQGQGHSWMALHGPGPQGGPGPQRVGAGPPWSDLHGPNPHGPDLEVRTPRSRPPRAGPPRSGSLQPASGPGPPGRSGTAVWRPILRRPGPPGRSGVAPTGLGGPDPLPPGRGPGPPRVSSSVAAGLALPRPRGRWPLTGAPVQLPH